jgi:hypothetical protein
MLRKIKKEMQLLINKKYSKKINSILLKIVMSLLSNKNNLYLTPSFQVSQPAS